MRILIIICALFTSISGDCQEEILNQCFVLTIDSEKTSDLRGATFDLPFAAMRRSKKNEQKVVPHYMFDIQSNNLKNNNEGNGLQVSSIRPYVYGEKLAENEIAFFLTAWPEDQRPKESGAMLASFPSINNHPVTTDVLIINKNLEFPKSLVEQLELESNILRAGHYKLYKQDVIY